MVIPSVPRSLKGMPDPATGMLVDFTELDKSLESLRSTLDHKLLNRVEQLGLPTLENLSRFIWQSVRCFGNVVRVTVYRDSCGQFCTYYGGEVS